MYFNLIVLEVKHGNETYQIHNLIHNIGESYFKKILRDEYGLDKELNDSYGIRKFRIKDNFELNMNEFHDMKKYIKLYDNDIIDVVNKYGSFDKK